VLYRTRVLLEIGRQARISARVIATFATVVFSKGKGRLVALFASLSVVIVIAFLSYLEMILE
jgi:hypothetical protein